MTFVLSDFYEKDAHNASVHHELPDGRLVVFYCGHGEDWIIRWRISPTGQVADLGSANEINIGGGVTYMQVYENNGELFLFTRRADWRWSFVKCSVSANPLVFSSPRILFQNDTTGQVYCLGRVHSPGLITFVVYKNAGSSGLNPIHLMEVNLTTGDVTAASGSLGNLDGTGLPALITELDVIIQPPEGDSFGLLDTARIGDAFYVFYAQYTDADPSVAMYKMARASWADRFSLAAYTITDIVSAGAPYSTVSNYFGRLCVIADTALHLVIAREASGTWYIERWTSANGTGSDWVTTQLRSSANVMLANPMPILNGVPGRQVLWQEIRSFVDYTEYDMGLAVA